jgi:hypothetical protein
LSAHIFISPLKAILFLLFSCFWSISLLAQKKNEHFRYHIRKASSPIVIDGQLDEKAWLEADSAANFFMITPMDTSLAQVQTTVRMTYDQENIYLIAVCYNALPGPYIVESLKRDFSFVKNDNFLLFMDPFDVRTDGFSFGANAAGAQWDGSMYEGGKVDLSWDNKWVSAVQNYPDRWVFEAAIPFKSIRYKQGMKEWGINFSRNDLKTTEKSSWAPVPRQFPSAALAYTGTLVWDEAPPVAGRNISVIPYVLGGSSKDYILDTKTAYRKDIGGDVKVSLNSSLNLDLTVNPDFSQVDVDQQVINLNRFELFFTEKRQFFLENGDLFANFGYANIRPFFSRRIGLNAPIRFGARLTGKLNKDWRIGVMDIQTGNEDAAGLPAQNFGVITLQRRVFSRSNIGIMLINKETTGNLSDTSLNKFNRNVGLEYNLASSNNLWTGKAMMLKSFSPGENNQDLVQAAHLQYLSKKWTFYIQEEYVGKNYLAEVGYVPRNGYFKINPLVLRNFFPKSGAILSHGLQFSSNNYLDEKMKPTDNENILSYLITFRNRATLNTSFNRTYIKLLRPFDPTNIGKGFLETGSAHRWNMMSMELVSKPQSVFTYVLGGSYGGYYDNGKRYSLTSQVGYRFQPYVSIGLSSTYNNLSLPQPFGNTSFWLVGPRTDVTFSNKLYLTTFIQYNEQLKNTNVNARLQWRYKPASDFFIVYADNYLPSPFMVKNRQLVLKWTYWWNI